MRHAAPAPALFTISVKVLKSCSVAVDPAITMPIELYLGSGPTPLTKGNSKCVLPACVITRVRVSSMSAGSKGFESLISMSKRREAPLLLSARQGELTFVDHLAALHDEYNGLGIIDVRRRILAQQHHVREFPLVD